MRVRVEDVGGCRRDVHVEIPADAVASEYDDIVKSYARVARISGFRKGKAPADVVERRFSSEIAEDAKDRLVPRFYREAVESEGIDPVAVVGVRDVNLERESGLAFVATIDVAPKFKLPRYRRIPLRREPTAVTDKDVDDAVNRMREAGARYEDVSGRAARRDDLVRLDYAATCEGRPLGELAPAAEGLAGGEDFWAMLAEPEFVPGLVDEIVGMEEGQEKTATVTFPDDFRVGDVAGKQAEYKLSLKGIRERKLPDIDEEFLKRLDAESEADLRGKIEQGLTEQAEQNEQARLRSEIGRFLLSKTSFEVPRSLVEREQQQAARSMVQNLAMQGGTREQIEQHRDEILSAAAQQSLERVKLSYILERVADAEDLQVADSEVTERIESMASRRNITPERMKADLGENGGTEWLKDQVRAEKTLDFLLEQAKVKG